MAHRVTRDSHRFAPDSRRIRKIRVDLRDSRWSRTEPHGVLRPPISQVEGHAGQLVYPIATHTGQLVYPIAMCAGQLVYSTSLLCGQRVGRTFLRFLNEPRFSFMITYWVTPLSLQIPPPRGGNPQGVAKVGVTPRGLPTGKFCCVGGTVTFLHVFTFSFYRKNLDVKTFWVFTVKSQSQPGSRLCVSHDGHQQHL